MNLPLISQLPEQYATVLLLVMLVVAFVIAFKIMKIVFETILVSILSAGFYGAIVQLFNYSFSLQQMLSYAFLGATLYMTYTFLASAYSIIERLISIPYRLLMFLIGPIKSLLEKIWSGIDPADLLSGEKEGKTESGDSDEGGDDSSPKEVIVDSIDDE